MDIALVPFANRQKRTVFRYLKTARLFYCFIITLFKQIGEPLAFCYFTPSDKAHHFSSADTGNTDSY